MSADDPTHGDETTEQAPAPFDGQPRDLPAPKAGCSRMVVAGCAVVLLLVGLGVLTLMLKARDVVAWSLGKVRVEIERTLPEDLPADESVRLTRAFNAVEATLEEGDLDAVAFQGLQTQLLFFAGLGRAPTIDEVRTLAAALERFAGLEAPEGAPPPAGERSPPADTAPAEHLGAESPTTGAG